MSTERHFSLLTGQYHTTPFDDCQGVFTRLNKKVQCGIKDLRVGFFRHRRRDASPTRKAVHKIYNCIEVNNSVCCLKFKKLRHIPFHTDIVASFRLLILCIKVFLWRVREAIPFSKGMVSRLISHTRCYFVAVIYFVYQNFPWMGTGRGSF